MRCIIFFLLLFLFVGFSKCDLNPDIDKVTVANDFEKRARIIMIDRNMWVLAGSDGNITLLTSFGGRIFIDDVDANTLTHFASFKKYYNRLQILKFGHLRLKRAFILENHRAADLSFTQNHIKMKDEDMTENLKAIQSSKRNQTLISDKLKSRLAYWQREVEDLEKKLNNSACEVNQCANGGICIPKIGDTFLCLCSQYYSGDKCEDNVDECSEFNQCKNDGTCVNIRDGFRCDCKEGFHGPICQYHQEACSQTSQLCGPHGACVSAGQNSYDCHCHVGFKKSEDLKNPTCVDIDECLTNPCHPGVECINLDGSYQCFGCPPGYKMDHIGCVDINECDSIGACARNVECRNLLGSYECGPCPRGYSGDSRKRCTRETPCTPNPCAESLVCLENDHYDNPDGYICVCQENDILDSESGTCNFDYNFLCPSNNSCLNGAWCEATNATNYKCNCDRGYVGKHCEHASPCFSNPCKNGVCQIRNERDHVCLCDPHFYGDFCEFEETMFDVHLTNLSGTYRFDPPTNNIQIIQNTYLHIAQPDSLLKITFTHYENFEDEKQKLILYDGRDENSHIFKTFYGEKANAPVMFKSITMTTTYALLKYVGSTGEYRIKYEVVPRGCGYRTSKPKGHLVIPEYNYDDFVNCEWFISAPMDKLIKIRIPSLAVHSGKQIDCNQNQLEIHDEFTFQDQTIIEKICSNVKDPYPLISTGPFLTVSFISNILPPSKKFGRMSGFSLAYEFIEREGIECGFEVDNKDQIIGFHGYIESPNYGSLYPPNTKCYWEIFGAGKNEFKDDFVTKITFDSFDLPSSEPIRRRMKRKMIHWTGLLCKQDILLVSGALGDSTFFSHFCNDDPPSPRGIMFQGDTTIKFSSDDSVQGKGFRLKYEVVCERTLEGNGSVQTWNFPNGGSAGKCVYIINAEPHHTIQVKFKSIELNVLFEQQCASGVSTNNATNYVEIDGDLKEGPLRFTCQKDDFVDNGIITVSGLKPVTITVVSDGSPKFKGISFEYSTYPSGCGEQVDGDFFTSPGFPFDYSPNSKCIYRIKSNDAIIITFEEFDLTAYPDNLHKCVHDRVEIHGSDGKLVDDAKFCGSVIPPPITILNGQVDVIFYSENITSTGFRARVERIPHSDRTKCDRTLTSPDGIIYFDSKHYFTCTNFSWHITFQRNEMIRFTIHYMYVPCKTSNLEIFDGHSQESGYIYKSCLHENIQEIETMSNRATIVFNQTSSEPASFKISYEKVLGCALYNKAFSGFISAPQYPHREQRKAECSWSLVASHGNRMQLTIRKMDDLVNDDENCTTGNFLEVYERSRAYQKLASYCHKTDENMTVTSEKDMLYVNYLQNMNRPTKVFGFLAHFTTICKDIVLTQPYGIIESPGYPNNVPVDVQCFWTIKAPVGNRIVMKFTYFDIQIEEDGQDCSLNKFSIDDGDMKTAILKNGSGIFDSTEHWFCEDKTPVELKSRHNIAHLYYKSTVQSNLFLLHYYTLGCIKEIRTSENIQITRDTIDLDAEFFECQYTIIAPVDKRINLIINSFDIAHNDDCKYTSDGTFRGMAIFMGSSNSSGYPQQTICSKNSKYEYKSHTSQIFVYIALNERSINPDKNIFLDASVTFIDPDFSDSCGAHIDLSHKHQHTLMSPNYPSIYPSQANCIWKIEADLGYHVDFKVEEFHEPNEKNNQGAKDFDESVSRNGIIVVTNEVDPNSNDDDYISLPILDQKSASKPINNTWPTANVYFRGANLEQLGDIDRQQKITGFLMKVKQVCGGVVYAEPEEKTLKLDFESGQNCTVVIKSKNENEGVHAGIEIFTNTNGSTNFYYTDFINVFTDNSLVNIHRSYVMYGQSYDAEKEVRFEYVTSTKEKHHAVIKYSSNIEGCQVIPHQKNTLLKFSTGQKLDCSWNIENTPGSIVILTLRSLMFPSSPHCAESYVEVRESNATGKLLSHSCSQYTSLMFKHSSLYFHYKYGSNDDNTVKKFILDANVKKQYGGQTTSPILKSPKIIQEELFEWNLDSLEKPHILIRTSGVKLSSKSYLKFKQSSDDRKTDDAYDEIVLGLPSDKTFILPYKTATIEVKMEPKDEFTIEWEAIDENDYNKTISQATQASKYDCGGPLTPTWEWQEITSPLPPGQASGYENNIHCMWTMKREHVAGFELKFEHLDLEYDPDCLKDYVLIDELEDIETEYTTLRFCGSSSIKDSIDAYHQEMLYIHFITDNSGGGTGFKMLYRLSCKVEYTLPTSTSLAYVVSNPPNAQDCHWYIMSQKNRRLIFEIESLNIGETEDCFVTNSLTFMGVSGLKDTYFCGKFENLKVKNYQTTHSLLYIRYSSDGTLENQGFKLTVQEVAVKCGGETIHLDTTTCSKTIYSPDYPMVIPHSSECDYVISAQQGSAIQLSFDSDNFDFQDGPANDTETDYLEVRDGPSEHSTLIGRYRGKTPPSSIVSTGNFMFMRLHTDNLDNSRKFVAQFQLARCGGTVIIDKEDKEYSILSDYYYSNVCIWRIRTANTHMIMVKIVDLWASSNQNACKNTKLDIYDGKNRNSTKLYPRLDCNSSLVDYQYKRSSSSEVSIFYSGWFENHLCSTVKCGFKILFKMSEEKCGGTIKDDQGKITLPGYPGKLLPHVKCIWNFKTDPGTVYELRFRFLETTNFNDGKGCYRDIKFFDLSEEPNFNYYDLRNQGKMFCNNSLTVTSVMDGAVMVYDDEPTSKLQEYSSTVEDAWYSPFEITYKTIPAEYVETSCTSMVNQNQSYSLDPALQSSPLNFTYRCHLAVLKPSDFGSVNIKINNLTQRERERCSYSDLFLAIKSDSPIDINSDFCKFDETLMIFINPSLDIFVHLERLRQVIQNNTSIEIEFQECGGHIKEPMIDNITSPNFASSRYLQNSKCRWLIEAPVGQVIQLRVVEMDITFDYDCKNDRLMIGEGRQNELNILHTYCHTMKNTTNSFKGADHLDEHFKQIRSKSRFISIVWTTDDSREGAGWKLEYEFVNEDETCGSHQIGMSGVIHTANYSVQNYGQNQECIWDIEVPFGYHIQLHYTYFKVEPSTNCENDGLYISQLIHHAGINRAGDSFSTKTSVDESPLCGLELPPDYNAHSQKLRITFKSNDKLEEKGFHLSWKAVCGMTFNSTHGTITSPDFNDKSLNGQNCEYVINSKPNEHISLKFEYFDLLQYERDPECDNADYIEIKEHNSEYRKKYCKAMAPRDGMSLVGPAVIRFYKKGLYGTRRGFKFHYTINECGGDIHLQEGAELSRIIQHERFEGRIKLDCVWNISKTPDRELVVKFEYFNLVGNRCNTEFIELFDSPYQNSSLGKYCGGRETMPNHVIQSSGPNLLIHAYSDTHLILDNTDNPKMFKVIVTSTPGAKSGCGGILEATNEAQFITPPKDASGFGYPKHISCGWLIKAPKFHQIKIELQKTNMKCESDELLIYDGKEGLSTKLFNNKCVVILKSLEKTSSGNQLFVRFNSRDGNDQIGFKVAYSLHFESCGGWSHADDLRRNSSMDLDGAANCRHYIQGNSVDPIIIRFFDVNISKDDCKQDFIEVRDVGSLAQCQHPECVKGDNLKKVVKYCGGDKIPPHISTTNTMMVTIRVSKKSYIAFDYQLLNNCNRTIDTMEFASGFVESRKNSDSKCVTTFKNSFYETESKSLLIVFNSFGIYEVIESNINTTLSYPATYFSNEGDSVKIVCAINGEYEASFYTVLKEEANYTEFSPIHSLDGVVSNAEYPKTFMKSMTQVFTMQPPKSQVCKFETYGSASRMIYNDCEQFASREYTLIQQFLNNDVIGEIKFNKCNQTKVQDFSIFNGQGVRFTFVTDDDSNNDGVGFRMRWHCHDEHMN